MRTMLKKFAPLAIQYGDDALILFGCLCLLYGLAQIHPVFAWLAGGLMLIIFGILLGKAKLNAN